MKTITLNEKEYQLYWVSGKVAETNKNMETRVHGGGGGGYVHQGSGYSAPVSISSTTIVHDQVFLVDDKGGEHSLRLQNWDISCRSGHELTAFSIAGKGEKNATYFIIINHTLGQRFFNDDQLRKIFRYKLQTVLMIAGGLGFLLGWKMAGSFGGGIGFGLVFLLIGRFVWARTANKKAIENFKAGVDNHGYNLVNV